MKTKIIVAILTLGVFASWHAAAQTAPPPGRMTYQGQLRSGQVPLVGGHVDLSANVYSTWDLFDPRPPEAGTTNLNVLLDASGLFTMELDLPAAVFDGRSLWLELGVRTNGSSGPFTRLEPRQPLAPTPYAFHAVTSQSAATAATATTATVASNYTGQVADAQLSTNVALLSSNATFSGFVTFRPSHPWDPPFGVGSTGVVVDLDTDTLDGKHASDFWQLGGNDVNANSEKIGIKANANWNPELQLIADGDIALRLSPIAGGTPAVIGGHSANVGNASGAAVGGGGSQLLPNNVGASFGTIGGGEGNTVLKADGTIGGGAGNSINLSQGDGSSTIGGGMGNVIWDDRAVIGGGAGNTINAAAFEATIGGGAGNSTWGRYSIIAGGKNNTIFGGMHDVIGGGNANQVFSNTYNATISGGSGNAIMLNTESATLGGGGANLIAPTSDYATIGGGHTNSIQPASTNATIGGGHYNVILADSQSATIGGGEDNAIGTNAPYGTIPGGYSNQVTASYGFAAGRRAQALHQGAFVWADSTDEDFASTNANEFAIRARGGVRFDTGGAGLLVDGQSLSGSSNSFVLGADSVFTTNLVADAVTGPKIADGTITSADVSAASFSNVFWKVDGNAGTTAGTHFVGTTDNQALDLRVNNLRALRLEPDPTSPNVIGGFAGNATGAGISGAAIGGGGQAVSPNYVAGSFGTISGGSDNQVLAMNATVGGGQGNYASGFSSTIAGGNGNQIQPLANDSTIGGGLNQTIQNEAEYATIGGGTGNTIQTNADYSTISGGGGHTVGSNVQYGTVPGGRLNDVQGSYGFAAGRRAKSKHQGAFVWADSTDADFASTANDQFLIRASGNVGINKPNPASALDVNGTVTTTGSTVLGTERVTGLFRSGSEAGTPEPPSPAGLIIRRINSTSMTAGTVVARTDTMTLERDGSSGGFNIRFAPATGNFMVSSMQVYCCGYASSTYGNSQYSSNPGSPVVYNIVSSGYNIVYFHCMFGRADPGGHITEVSLVRFNPGSSQWFGTVTSTVNQ